MTQRTPTPMPNNVIIYISELDRRKLFEKPIVTIHGEQLWLTTGIKADENMENSYSQSVTVGTVVAVGSNVKGIQRNDYALLDYQVDLSNDFFLHSDGLGKYVSILANTSYEKEDLVIDSNRRTPHPTIVHKAGEFKSISMLIAVVRDDKVIANRPYVISEHEKPSSKFEQRGGLIFTTEEKRTAVKRKIIAVSERDREDDAPLKPGDNVYIEDDAIFDREINGKVYDIFFETDVLAIENDLLSSTPNSNS